MGMEEKVVWTEGIFITPQHFQQLDRYFDDALRYCIKIRDGFFWGFSSLSINTSELKSGILSLNEAEGFFPDGSFFSFSRKQLEKLRFRVPIHTQNAKICLAINLPSSTSTEIVFGEQREGSNNYRFTAFEKKLVDTSDENLSIRSITLAELRPVLLLESEISPGQIGLPVAWVQSCSANSEIILDKNFIPPSLNCQEQAQLSSYIHEIYGLLLQKSESLATAINNPNLGTSLEVVDFLMLQTINRYLAYLKHEQNGANKTHPEQLFINLSKLCGDLMTFLPTRTLSDFPVYIHNDLASCYHELFFNLRNALSMVLEQRAIRIPLELRDETTRVAQTPEQSLLNSASFILAVKSDVSSDVMRQKIPSMIKVGTVEKIRELTAYHLPGIRIHALSVAPRELPYHSGYVYFELDKHTEMWELFNSTSGMAFHLAGDFPNLDFEFWAIKN